ncbi:GNAT family N-acetyltransferase [Aestuariivirga sp.]|uniref:GNAT family N-acetyltransferase n=1 Tax=Aestuariivirga sp. TaxID=2650926 RepID=UPI0035947A50
MTADTGYSSPQYWEALGMGGTVSPLTKSGGAMIVRAIPGSGEELDAIAPYPFLCCTDWAALEADMGGLPRNLVSVTAVTDPLGNADEALLRRCFNHMVRSYKTHYTIGLTAPLESFADPHHLGCARKALKKLDIEVCADPEAHIGDWLRLYANLVARHGIGKAARMSEASLRMQMRVPGARLFRAARTGRTVGMIMVMETAPRAYFHLGAYDAEGYRLNASYALVAAVIRHYAAKGFTFLSIGAGAGAFGDGESGLTAFKKGWASGQRMTWLCGHIADRERYDRLTLGMPDGTYFPGYRAGEYD